MARRDNVPLQRILRGLVVDRVDFVGAGANGESDIVLFKRHKGAPTPPTTEDPNMDQLTELQAAIDAAVEKAVGEAQAAADAALAKFTADLEALAQAGDTDGTDDVTKNLDPAVAEIVKAEQARTAALEAQVAKMQDAEVERVVKARAESFKLVGGVDEVASVLKRATVIDPELAADIDAILSKVQDRLAESDLLKPKGTRGGDATDPESRLEAAVAKFQAADPNLTVDAAISKAVAEDRTLYTEVLAAQRARTTSAA